MIGIQCMQHIIFFQQMKIIVTKGKPSIISINNKAIFTKTNYFQDPSCFIANYFCQTLKVSNLPRKTITIQFLLAINRKVDFVFRRKCCLKLGRAEIICIPKIIFYINFNNNISCNYTMNFQHYSLISTVLARMRHSLYLLHYDMNVTVTVYKSSLTRDVCKLQSKKCIYN